jgi:hypothetical protein
VQFVQLFFQFKEMIYAHSKNSPERSRKQREFVVPEKLHREGLDLGEDVEIPAWEETARLVIRPGRDFGIIGDYPVGNTLYAIPLRFVAWERIVLEHCWIESAWDDQTIVLPYLPECGGRYRLGSLSYLTSEVLNDHFDKPFTMNRGDILEGMLLAYGCVAIPENARGGNASVQVTLVDTLGREARGEIRLAVECSPNMERSLATEKKGIPEKVVSIRESAGTGSSV